MRADYNVTVDLSQSNAVLRQLTIAGSQGSSPLLHGELTSPMRVSWGTAAGEMGDSTFTFTLTDLNLPDWKPFIGDTLSSGKISAQAKIVSQKGGELLTFDVGSQASDLSGKFGSNRISQAGLALQVSGQATDLKQFNLTRYNLQVTHQKDAVVSVTGSGTYVKGEKPADNGADLQLNVQAHIAKLMEVFPQPDASLSSGTVDLKGRLCSEGGITDHHRQFRPERSHGQVRKKRIQKFCRDGRPGPGDESGSIRNPQSQRQNHRRRKSGRGL